MISRTPASTRVRSWARPSRRSKAGYRPGLLSNIGPPAVAGAGRAAGPAGPAAFAGAGRLADPGQPQAVADPALGVNQVGPVTRQLAPQVRDVGRDDGAGPAKVIVPDMGQQLGAGEDP